MAQQTQQQLKSQEEEIAAAAAAKHDGAKPGERRRGAAAKENKLMPVLPAKTSMLTGKAAAGSQNGEADKAAGKESAVGAGEGNKSKEHDNCR